MLDAPIALLPGLLCDATVWQAQSQALGAERCVVPRYGDLHSITGMAERVLQQISAPRFAVVGHSMGGRVALELMRLAPERVLRLALLDTGMDPLPAGEAGEAERSKRLALLAQARTQGMLAMGQAWARGMVHPAQLDGPVFEAILTMIERQTPELFEAQIQALLGRPDARPVLAGLRCPTLIACGRQDAWSPLARHEQMCALAPVARLAVIEDSGHMCTMEQPAAVSALLRGWLQD